MAIQRLPLFALLVFILTSCSSDLPEEPPQASEPVGAQAEIVRLAARIATTEVVWRDGTHGLFQPIFPPDEGFFYRAINDGVTFAIPIWRYGSTWQGRAIAFDTEHDIQTVTGTSLDDCISKITAAYGFKALERQPH